MDEDKAADRWYRRYLELQERKQSGTPKGPDSDMEAALRSVEERLRSMNVQMYGTGRRVSGSGAKRAMLAKQRARLLEAQRQRARAIYQQYQNSGAPFSLAVKSLQEDIGVDADEARALMEQVRQERRGSILTPDILREFEEAIKTLGAPGVFKEPERDTRGPLSTGTGRRPQPAIAKVKVVAFRTAEWADPNYVGTEFGDSSDWVKERKGLHVVDIDGTEVYVAVEAVQREIALGKVPGYAALTPEEADSLHLVLVEAEHYQQALLRQATLEGDHDPDAVLAVARANGAQAAYRKRLGLPKHTWTEECCGQWVAPVTKEASE